MLVPMCTTLGSDACSGLVYSREENAGGNQAEDDYNKCMNGRMNDWM